MMMTSSMTPSRPRVERDESPGGRRKKNNYGNIGRSRSHSYMYSGCIVDAGLLFLPSKIYVILTFSV